ncbi:phage late control D family protein [Mannheimia indoligenes]|uniref:phage late control D family protein n=1 Tax=Mannheimia indoligenes TaxID=3103145 RepID=UPI002FE525E1
MDFLTELTNHNHRTPAISVTVRPKADKEGKGKDISTLITHRLIQLTLTDSRGFEADQLDLVLDDTDGLLELPSRGAVLSIGLGWKNAALTYKGEYTVDELTHDGPPDKVTIRARSADLRGSLMNRHERSFHRTTIGKIVKQIADENKLKAIMGKEFENYEIKHIDQTNESSINLLQRLAEQFDAIATVKNGNLLFIKAGNGTTASGKPLPLFLITRSLGDSHSFSIAEGDNYKAVKAYWHNTDTGKRGEVTWDENSQVKKVTKPTMRKKTKVKRGSDGKAIKGKDGKSIKETVFVQGKGRKVNQVVQSKPIESDSEVIKTLRHTYATEQSAINACKRNFEKLQRGVATFSLTLAEGNAELIPELPVQVTGFKAEIDSNEWIISQVTHSLSKGGGFTTALEMELKPKEEKGEG